MSQADKHSAVAPEVLTPGQLSASNLPMKVFIEQRPLSGILFIGDPHIEGRTPGFRCDNYPETILNKLQWCVEYCRLHHLQPVLLGDVFDKPRDNPNWLLARLLDLFSDNSVPTIFGNHDCANPHLDENDSLTLLAKAGAIRLLDENHLWATSIENRSVVIGGSPYRYPIPESFSIAAERLQISFSDAFPGSAASTGQREEDWHRRLCNPGLVLWLTHHDLVFPNEYEAVVTRMFEIEGIDYIVNGHIHRRASADVIRGRTTWVNPGSIVRRSRSDSIRRHEPSALRMDIAADGQWLHYIKIPHKPAEKVFYDLDSLNRDVQEDQQSSFVSGLAMLQSQKTESGAGLIQFLQGNVEQFEPEVSSEVMRLARTVLNASALPETN